MISCACPLLLLLNCNLWILLLVYEPAELHTDGKADCDESRDE
jgi:hypothetical protein